jgi:pyruvate/2-oxoglutarate dehydrogenase complex dihydrolipoamide dehydrogenase (E3) component
MRKHGYEYDIIVIGLGPAGMAVAIMASEMGLKVCAVEKNKIGGECMNVGCIPSKSLLRMAAIRHAASRAPAMGLAAAEPPAVLDVFGKIQAFIEDINTNKTRKMFDKVELILGEGPASFADGHTVAVGARRFSAKTIFVCTGSRPALPPIPGLDTVDPLTNENVFAQSDIPESLVILGGGAIGCEMAQAFRRMGTRQVAVVHADAHLLPVGDPDFGELLEAAFRREGIAVYNGRKIERVEKCGAETVLTTDRQEKIGGRRLLVAAGRQWRGDELALAKAGVESGPRGIRVNRRLRTTNAAVYAPGDANGGILFSHAAMHQGMLALMNALIPGPFGFDYRKYVVPWTVFTEPQVSAVGLCERDLQARGTRYETVVSRYEDYGAAIAEGIAEGWVKAFIHPLTGRIYGARIAGEGSGEMIGEWALAIQKKIRIWDIMFLQHSFPTMSFLSKRVAETWMMNRMPRLRGICRLLYGSRS